MDEDNVRPLPPRRAPRSSQGSTWRRWRARIIFIAVPLVLVVASLLRFWVDLLWFGEVGQREVLVTRVQWGLAMGLGFGLFTFAVLYVNSVIARRVARNDLYVPFLAVGADPEAPEQPVVPHFVLRPVLLGVSTIGAVIAGLVMGGNWETVLRFMGRSDFGVTDPHFDKDASFYVFTMPLLEMIARSMQVLLVFTGLVVIAAYVATGVIRYTPLPRIARSAIVHLSWLVAAFLLISAFQFRLSIWGLATSTRGVVAGAGWTDVHARIPGYWLMIVASIILAVVVVVYARKERWRVVGGAVVGWFAASVIVTGLVPSLVQNVLVEPNELERESQVLKGNIANTRAAFDLDSITTTKEFNDAASLDADALLRDNTGTTDNLRLWSPFVLADVVRQEQVIRRYYSFNVPDVDRYTLDGEYRQVMVSVRELDPDASAIAPGWTNERLAYTHGFGAVATLPNAVTRQGKPEYLLKNLPPTATKQGESLELTRPEVYFGEEGRDFVIVATKQGEISGAADEESKSGESNARSSYTGDGGIKINGLARRIAFAATFQDPRILFSGQFTDKSRIMFRREITERVREVAPFLETDRDPYAVLIDGRIKWIVDAYTTSDRFPYSESIQIGAQNTDPATGAPAVQSVNYVRNSVKAVIDAYEGDVTLYVMDEKDPILGAWRDIFPTLFTSSLKLPEGLRAHLRYPEDMFAVQTELWKRYHMSNVSDFYQRADEWAVPTIGNVEMQAYYVLAKLPTAKKEELLLIRPLTPRGRKNMVAYMVARSDGKNYGEVITLRLSRQELTQGPSQVQALIKQDSEVSEQVRKWTTGNNEVIYGDLLVLPVDDSLLYAQPIYLQNSEASIPEFQRIVLVLGDTIAWGSDYEEAAVTLLQKQAANVVDEAVERPAEDGGSAGGSGAIPVPKPGDFSGLSQDELLQVVTDVSEAYDKAAACQKAGDTACWAEQLEQVEAILRQARTSAS